MCTKKELQFSIFLIYNLAEKWQKSPADVYKILNETYWMITFLYVMILCTHWEQNIWLRILQSMQEKKVLLYDFISWYNWNFRKRIR